MLQALLGHADHRSRWTEDERRAVMADLLPDWSALRAYLWRFGSLSVLSTVLASFGLIANSVATVIAGMLIDPLMTPILGGAAALVHGEPRRFVRAFGILCGGTVLAVATGWTVAAISPAFTSIDDLTPEPLLRTSPSLLDLGVAVVAGISAGYVLTHREAEGTPGCARCAVALVPPLASIGVLLNVGATTQAHGAFLLYVTNLGAITLAAMTMLAVSGFGPGDLGRGTRLPVRAGFVFTGAVLVVIAVPMVRNTRPPASSITGTSPAMGQLSLHPERLLGLRTSRVRARLRRKWAVAPLLRMKDVQHADGGSGSNDLDRRQIEGKAE